MNLFAIIGLCLALLIALPIAYLGMYAPLRPNSLDFTFGYLILMYWPCTMLAFGIAIARGEFDSLWGGRLAQSLMMLSACTAVIAVNGAYFLSCMHRGKRWRGCSER